MKKDDFYQLVCNKNSHDQLSEVDRAILGYAEALTREPHGVGADHVGRLREVGLTDRAILDVCQITSYFNYVNRMAEGLGVVLETGEEP